MGVWAAGEAGVEPLHPGSSSSPSVSQTPAAQRAVAFPTGASGTVQYGVVPEPAEARGGGDGRREPHSAGWVPAESSPTSTSRRTPASPQGLAVGAGPPPGPGPGLPQRVPPFPLPRPRQGAADQGLWSRASQGTLSMRVSAPTSEHGPCPILGVTLPHSRQA